MSVLINGMEMPKTCGVCPLFRDDSNDYCMAARSIFLSSSIKPDWCPLVPLPEGHGRLIDADALIRDKSGEATLWCGYEYQDHSIVFEEDIKNALTIVPAEGGDNNEHV